jgi:hypothetical protein
MKPRDPHKLIVPVPRPVAGETEAQSGWPLSWFRAWDRFWFKPSDPVVLGLMRVLTGTLVVYVHVMYSFGLLSYVGADGWVDQGTPQSAAHYLRYDVPFYHQPSGWEMPEKSDELLVGRGHLFWSIYYHVHDPVWVYTIHFAIIGIMILFTIGLWTRVTSVLTWVGAMCYLQRAPTLLFGMDTMMNLLLIYLMIGPSGAALSVDDRLRRRRERAAGLGDRPSPPLVTATLATRLVQINFCLIYLGSGTSKLLGSAWWNGTAIWGTLANSYFAPLDQAWYAGSLRFLSEHRWLWELSMSASCFFTLFVEIGLPFLVWNRHLRWWMVSGSILLHAGIGLFMGLVTFSLCMLTMVLAFVPPEAVRDFFGRLAAAWQRSARIERPLRGASDVPLTLSRR